MLSVTSPAPGISHLSLDIFHLPFIRLRCAMIESDDLAGFENEQMANLK